MTESLLREDSQAGASAGILSVALLLAGALEAGATTVGVSGEGLSIRGVGGEYLSPTRDREAFSLWYIHTDGVSLTQFLCLLPPKVQLGTGHPNS
jgi:hypothetical protein